MFCCSRTYVKGAALNCDIPSRIYTDELTACIGWCPALNSVVGYGASTPCWSSLARCQLRFPCSKCPCFQPGEGGPFRRRHRLYFLRQQAGGFTRGYCSGLAGSNHLWHTDDHSYTSFQQLRRDLPVGIAFAIQLATPLKKGADLRPRLCLARTIAEGLHAGHLSAALRWTQASPRSIVPTRSPRLPGTSRRRRSSRVGRAPSSRTPAVVLKRGQQRSCRPPQCCEGALAQSQHEVAEESIDFVDWAFL